MGVKRFDFIQDHERRDGWIEEAALGQYVLANDYDALAAELADQMRVTEEHQRLRYQCEAENTTLTERIRALEAALSSLRNETRGIIGAFELEVRPAIGNTNWSCLFRRLDQADELLTASETACGEKPPIGFGVPTLADRVKEIMKETGATFECALQTTAHECELRSEAIFAVRQYFDHYEPEVNRG